MDKSLIPILEGDIRALKLRYSVLGSNAKQRRLLKQYEKALEKLKNG